jgi:GNAT superfamily N-acetyltransferase
MLDPTSTTLEGPDGSINVNFSEATTEQRLQCCKLAATAFAAPLSETDYIEREEYLSQRPLARDKGLRFWCLALAEDPAQVLATCKTIYRDILIRDTNGSQQEKCFCVASVVTDSKFRRYGLATLLLKEVVKWMDRLGDAAASMLYTSIGDVRTSLMGRLFFVHCSDMIVVLCQQRMEDVASFPIHALASLEPS